MPEKMPNKDLKEILGTNNSTLIRKHKSLWFIGAASLLLILVFILIWQPKSATENLQYKTQEVRRGSLVITVSATGNLEPTNQVDVSSELSGIIESVMVDYNDYVKAGQVLARLDTDKLKAQTLQSEASLASAEAKVKVSQATVFETKIKLQRCQQLVKKQLCAQEEEDIATAAYRRALAEEGSARAQVAEAQAKLDADRTNLAKAEIHSPINGIVLIRSAEPGQTVAASLQAPVLFTIAEDLSEMELHVDIDEADVGMVREGQVAHFTVDAFPDQVFNAQITQVRYGAQEVDGVITYQAILKVDNTELSLRPRMTATAEITVTKINDALLVPNAALRFNPVPRSNKKSISSGGSLFSKIMPRPPGLKKPEKNIVIDKGLQQVWILKDNKPFAIPVSIGTSDGIWTEITQGELQVGMLLLTATVKTGR